MTRDRQALLYGLGAVLAWSTVATAFKLGLRHLSPAQLLLYASLSSLLVLSGILRIQHRLDEVPAAFRQHWRRSLLLGALNPFLYYLVLFQAYARLPAQEAQAINYTWALTLSLLAVPMRKQGLRTMDMLAAVLCYVGVLIIATRGALSSVHFSSPAGVALALASTLLWAIYWILNTNDPREPVIGLSLNFACSLPLIIGWSALTGQLQPVAWQGVLAASYVGIFEMGITFVLWLYALRLTSSTARIANLIFLSPLISLLLIHFVLQEPLYPSTGLGLALILTGLALQKIPVKNTRRDNQPAV